MEREERNIDDAIFKMEMDKDSKTSAILLGILFVVMLGSFAFAGVVILTSVDYIRETEQEHLWLVPPTVLLVMTCIAGFLLGAWYCFGEVLLPRYALLVFDLGYAQDSWKRIFRPWKKTVEITYWLDIERIYARDLNTKQGRKTEVFIIDSDGKSTEIKESPGRKKAIEHIAMMIPDKIDPSIHEFMNPYRAHEYLITGEESFRLHIKNRIHHVHIDERLGKKLFVEDARSVRMRQKEMQKNGAVMLTVSSFICLCLIVGPIIFGGGLGGAVLGGIIALIPGIFVLVATIGIISSRNYKPFIFYEKGIIVKDTKLGVISNPYKMYVALTYSKDKDGNEFMKLHPRYFNIEEIKIFLLSQEFSKTSDKIKKKIYS